MATYNYDPFLADLMLRIADNSPMQSHGDVWRAIDRLAHEYDLSASGLARNAGLDPTTFNKIHMSLLGLKADYSWSNRYMLCKIR